MTFWQKASCSWLLRATEKQEMQKLMSDAPMNFQRAFVLIEPLFGYAEPGNTPHRPTLRQVLIEWADSINFFKHPTHALTTASFSFSPVDRCSLFALFCFLFYLDQFFVSGGFGVFSGNCL